MTTEAEEVGSNLEKKVEEGRVFTAINAFPAPSGSLHVGHIRGYVITDVLVRYMETKGVEAFYPFGIHATGKDISKILKNLAEWSDVLNNDFYGLPEKHVEGVISNMDHVGDMTEYVQEHLNDFDFGALGIARIAEKLAPWKQLGGDTNKYDISLEEANAILNSADPQQELLNHYKRQYFKNLIDLDCRFDTQSFFTTKDPEFHNFIQWQLRRAKKLGFLKDEERPSFYCTECHDTREIESSGFEVRLAEGLNPDDISSVDYTIILRQMV